MSRVRIISASLCMLLVTTMAQATERAGIIEATGVASLSVAPDRLFIEVVVGVKGGSENAAKTVTREDLARARTLVEQAGISESDIFSSGIVFPDAQFAANPVIDKRAFGSIVIKLEAPTTIAREHVETALRRGVARQSIRDGIFIDAAEEVFGLDDCDGAREKARTIAIETAKGGAERLEQQLATTVEPVVLAANTDTTDFESDRNATGFVCGKSATPPIYPAQIRYGLGSFGLPKDASVRVVERTRWSLDFSHLDPIGEPPSDLNSNQYFIPTDADLDATAGTIRASAFAYDDAKVDAFPSRRLELAIDRAEAGWLARELDVTVSGVASVSDSREIDPSYEPLPRFFDHNGTELTASFRIDGDLAGNATTIAVVGVSDEQLPADRALAAIVLHAPASPELATAIASLVARAGRHVAVVAAPDQTRFNAMIESPTVSTIEELRTDFARLPGIVPNADRVSMSYAVDDCFAAERRELARAVRAAHAIAIERAKAMGVLLIGVAGAASLGSRATGNSRCGPGTLEHLGPLPFDDNAPVTVREAARVAISYRTR